MCGRDVSLSAAGSGVSRRKCTLSLCFSDADLRAVYLMLLSLRFVFFPAAGACKQYVLTVYSNRMKICYIVTVHSEQQNSSLACALSQNGSCSSYNEQLCSSHTDQHPLY